MLGIVACAQTPGDTALPQRIDPSLIDTSLDYDQLFRDFDSIMDSILTPRSYFIGSLSIGKGFYNFENKGAAAIQTTQKLTYAPALGYYDKNGLGITVNGYAVSENKNLNLYQVAVSPSYDYIRDRRFATGISYTRFFTKDSLSFYTTPLQNELYAYFTYRKTWLRPTVTASYGWGNRTDYEKRELLIQDLRLRRYGYTYINTRETVSDFSVSASLRHDFYWFEVLGSKDHFRLSPQVSFVAGTQKFGFNQSANTYATLLRTGNSVLFSTDNVYLDDQLQFQPLSLTCFLRGEYSIGKFYIQPLLTFDYYFPATDHPFNTIFTLNLGVIL